MDRRARAIEDIRRQAHRASRAQSSQRSRPFACSPDVSCSCVGPPIRCHGPRCGYVVGPLFSESGASIRPATCPVAGTESLARWRQRARKSAISVHPPVHPRSCISGLSRTVRHKPFPLNHGNSAPPAGAGLGEMPQRGLEPCRRSLMVERKRERPRRPGPHRDSTRLHAARVLHVQPTR